MTKKGITVITCIILLTFQSHDLFAVQRLPATEAERIADQAEARKWLEEFELLKPELHDYYNQPRDENKTIMVFGGKSQFFSNVLQVDQRKGDVLLVVECIGDEKIEFNLTYNFRDFGWGFYANHKGAATSPETTSTNNLIQPPWTVDLDAEREETPLTPRRGIIFMHKDEFFMKKMKIWDMTIWDQLVSLSKEEPNAALQLRYDLLFKVGDTFYRTKAVCPLTPRQIQTMENIRIRSQKTDTQTIPEKEHFDRQLRVTVDKGEKGEPVIKLEPVKVETE